MSICVYMLNTHTHTHTPYSACQFASSSAAASTATPLPVKLKLAPPEGRELMDLGGLRSTRPRVHAPATCKSRACPSRAWLLEVGPPGSAREARVHEELWPELAIPWGIFSEEGSETGKWKGINLMQVKRARQLAFHVNEHCRGFAGIFFWYLLQVTLDEEPTLGPQPPVIPSGISLSHLLSRSLAHNLSCNSRANHKVEGHQGKKPP